MFLHRSSILAAAIGAPLVLLAALPSAAMATSESEPEPEFLFAINYSADDCTDAVLLQTYLSNTTYQVMGSTGMDSCGDNMMCRMDPDGHKDTCPMPIGSGENNETTKMYDMIYLVNETDGSIYSGSSSSVYFVAGPDVCRTPPDGSPGWYGGCGGWHFQLLDDLQSNPEMMANDNPGDMEKIQDFTYIVFYEDDACTEIASIDPAASGQVLTIPTVSDPGLSCRAQSVCAVDPSSDACVQIQDENSIATVPVLTRVDKDTGEVDILQCDTTNEAVDEDPCLKVMPQDCIKSSVFSNCYYRFLSGPTLAQNPRYLVGDFGDEPDTSGASPEASKVFTSIGYLMFSLLFFNAGH